jgi:transposase
MEHSLVVDGVRVVERLDVLEGPTGRRSWPEDVKARIVAESFVPSVSVAEVARRHGLRPQHLSDWRRLAREGKLVLPTEGELPTFAALEVDKPGGLRSEPSSSLPAATIVEIEADGLVVRLPGASSAERIAGVAAALKHGLATRLS